MIFIGFRDVSEGLKEFSEDFREVLEPFEAVSKGFLFLKQSCLGGQGLSVE